MDNRSFARRNPIERRKLLLRIALGVAVAVVVVCGLYSLGRRLEGAPYQNGTVRGDLSDRFADQPELVYHGKRYVPRDGLLTVLFIGIDRDQATSSPVSFRNGGQADFLMLAIVDSRSKTVKRLQIDRDTMAEITVLGVLGNNAGTRRAQICLAHGFGDGRAQSGRFTVEAVERLLYGIQIDHYVAIGLDAIGIVNDAVGGVTLTVTDDFSAYDASMIPGAEFTLDGRQAELFIRFRIDVGDGTNASRMRRQQTYLAGLMDRLDERMSDQPNFIGALYDALGDGLVTDMKRGAMINEAYAASKYATEPLTTLKGEYLVGQDGFVEFQAEEEALEHWVVETFYLEAE